MKILRLRLNNLASIAGEHCIDFESEPLANAGLIAITGKTGAGKSTLLDAMCLAFFDQIPRLNGAIGSLTDVSGQDISIKDAKHILRRGAISGFSEVDFIALDQKRYRARWDIRRSYKKLTGNLKVDRSVTRLEDNRVLTQKISECTSCIQSLIGLSFEQFTRAVLLAQSEVGAFLKAKDHERASLLEYLTNSNIFSLVSQRAFEKTKEIRIELDKKQEFSQHIQLLSTEEIATLEENKCVLEEKIQHLKVQQQQLESAQQWQNEAQRLNKEIEQQKQIAPHIEQQKEKATTYKQQLQYLDEFAEIRNSYVELITAQQQQTHFKQQLQTHAKQFELTEKNFQQQQQQQLAHESAVTEYESKLEQLQPKLKQGFELDAQRQHFLAEYQKIKDELHIKARHRTQQAEMLNQLDLEQKTILAKKNQLEEDLSKYQYLSKLAEEPKANIDKLQHIQSLWQKINLNSSENFNIEAFKNTYHVRFQNLENDIAQYGTLEELEEKHLAYQKAYQTEQEQQRSAEQVYQYITQYHEKKQNLQQQKDQLEKQTQRLAEASITVQKQQSAFQQAESDLQALQKLIHEQKILQSKHITSLREQLKTNEACPVCGSKEHPFIEKKALLEQAMQSIHEQQEKEKQKIKEEAFTAWQSSQQNCARLETDIQHLNHHITQLQQEQTSSWHHIEQTLQQTMLDFSLEQPLSQLDNEITTLKQSIQLSHNAYQKNDQIRQSLKQQLKQHTQETECFNHIQQFETLTTFILDLIDSNDEKSQWKNQPLDNAKRYIQGIIQLTEAKKEYELHIQQYETLMHKKQLVQQKYATLDTEYQTLEKKLEYTKQIGLEIRTQINQLIQKHSTKHFTTVSEWQSDLYVRKNELHTQYQTIKKQFSETEQQYHHQQTQLNSLNQSLETWQFYEQEHLEKQNIWKHAHPLFTEDLIKYCLQTTVSDVQHLRQQLQEIEQTCIRYETQCQQTQHNHSIHQQKKPSCLLDHLDQQQQDNKQQLQDASYSRDEITAKLMSNAHAKAQQQHFAKKIEQLQQQVNRWAKISELIGSKDGAKFRRIAQEHHLDILIEYANQQLQPLSTRYALKRIENSLGLAIIDHEMNSEVRPVLSLSGGETFLVSLALALAIANMASGSMKLESLFIDEGFGTLDPSSLHIVMDALDRLQSQGRKVILISHVQEMHERIPIQVQVQSIGSGTSHIQIVG